MSVFYLNLMRIEVGNGGKPIASGSVEPFPMPALDAFQCLPVVTQRGNDIRIVAIWFKECGVGLFRKMVADIRAAGLHPVVVEPIGFEMPAILQHWGWRGSMVEQPDGQTCEEWRP